MLNLLLATLLASPPPDETLAGIACRSVHLAYQSMPRNAQALATEMEITRSAPGTYFCALGFSRGYYGLQELPNRKKVLIFSVWDPTEGDDPRSVPEDQRVQLLFKDPAVRTGRFGGEGTGGQSFLDFDWKEHTRYGFLVTARTEGHRTAYTAYFRDPDAPHPAWRKLITFATPAEGELLSGGYSFIEDFLRNRKSLLEPRTARFAPPWVYTAESNTWKPLPAARFTADSNPATNIDAGWDDQSLMFFLATGGGTKNSHAALRESITSSSAPAALAPPPRLPLPPF
jgi:catechol 2,3-dioxygenase-like lactoylglutathione lyase family enzyme